MRLTDGCLICARHLDANQNSNNGDWRNHKSLVHLWYCADGAELALSQFSFNSRRIKSKCCLFCDYTDEEKKNTQCSMALYSTSSGAVQILVYLFSKPDGIYVKLRVK